ncbi:DUF4249 family protein [uncultured Cytophaga sp.]|uniref:DUF4249 family protein n=1 Tax=uncultured Cytophaga sp. TaxID=160238 RepID=UPI00262B72A4|nr:DUF4249 family protein [uncultured Cytophaga sp.]
MKQLLIFACSILLFSCQKVIDIKPKDGEVKVIIQGYLYTDSIIKVRIAKSTNYLSPISPPGLGTAVITLSDNHGNSEVLTWNPVNKIYKGNALLGVVNDTYTLKVEFEGKTYVASSLLPYLEHADTIKIIKKPKTTIQDEKYEMKLYATISTSTDFYYLFKGYADNRFLNGPNDIYYADNKNLNGNLNGIDIGYDEYKVGEVAKLELYSLTEAAYKFYDAASLQLNNDGGFFSTPPANVPSMFDKGAIGLFQCSDIQVLTTTVLAQ